MTKKTTIVMVNICLAFFTMSSNAQELKNMSISIDPIDLVAGSIPLTFRMRVANRFSLGISAYDKFFSLTDTKTLGVGGGLSGKFHLSAPAFSDGWYIKPEMMAGYWKVTDGSEIATGYGMEPRLISGYDWIWASGFAVSFGLGIKYTHFIGKKESIEKLPDMGFHGFFPNADLSLGWAF